MPTQAEVSYEAVVVGAYIETIVSPNDYTYLRPDRNGEKYSGEPMTKEN
jgi:hypothetical protein